MLSEIRQTQKNKCHMISQVKSKKNEQTEQTGGCQRW